MIFFYCYYALAPCPRQRSSSSHNGLPHLGAIRERDRLYL